MSNLSQWFAKFYLSLFKQAVHPLAHPEANDGFIPQAPTPGDFVSGVAGLDFISIVPGRNWDSWLPELEVQVTNKIDLMRCVTEATLNSLETQINRMLALGLLPKATVDYLKSANYINLKTGKINFSKRYTAAISGTTKEGNSLLNVANSVRHDGLLPETDWPTLPYMSWSDHYSPIPQNLKDKAKNIYNYLNVLYEWVKYDGTVPMTEVYKQLEHAPLVIAVRACSPWYGIDPIPWCGISNANHGVELYKEPLGIFDSYDPSRKQLGIGYSVPWVMKVVIGPQLSAKAKALLARFEGKYIQRVKAQGQVYKIQGGKLIYLSPEKQSDGHNPLVDTALKELQATGKVVGLTEADFNEISV